MVAHNIVFTHIHADMKPTSVLDNFFVYEGSIDIGDSLSRHSHDHNPVRNQKKRAKNRIRKRRPAWYKKVRFIIQKVLIIHCKHPVHSIEREKFMMEILCYMIEKIPFLAGPKLKV